MMARRKGWELRLAAEIEAARAKPFRWGAFDCFLFAADCGKAMTGEDFAAPLRGRYSTAAGAARAALRFAGGGVEETLTKILGAPIAVAFARRGDVVTFEIPELGLAAGVVALNGVAAHAAAERGLLRLPLRLARCAWRVA